MITFKTFLTEHFLLEGGKATEALGTERVTKEDFPVALAFVAKHIGIGAETLKDRLLGSARLTAAGKKEDSGDIDLAILDGEVDRDTAVKQLTNATKNKPHVTGGTTFSFAVPVNGGKKVQVDLMFVPNIEWAKFSHFSSENSKYKSAVRNELIHSSLKYSLEPDKDLRLKDKNGNDIVRASRAYKLDTGAERIFKIAPLRKDGKGRVKGVVKATPDEVQATLDELNHKGKFSKDPEVIQDPEQFTKMLYGDSVRAQDIGSTEQLINVIKKYKAENADAIFKDAVRGIKRLKFDVPDELRDFA